MSLQIKRAWRLARAHGHHWAVSATPEALAAGRAILLRDAPPDEDREYLAWRLARPASVRGLDESDESDEEFGAAAGAALRAYALSDRNPVVPPTTEEECRALDALPRGPCGGIGWELDADGCHRHQTGTGRLRWVVRPDGHTTVEVWRPDGVVLRGTLTRGGSQLVVDVRGSYYIRHWRALRSAARALEAPLSIDGEAEADDYVRVGDEVTFFDLGDESLRRGRVGKASADQVTVCWDDDESIETLPRDAVAWVPIVPIGKK